MTEVTTEQRIARIALGILEKQGPDAVSMRRIAGAAGITPMAIYHHFPNREALLRSVVDKEFEAFLDIIRQVPARPSVEDHIIHIMDAYIDYAFARPHIFDYIFSNQRPNARRFPEDFRARQSPTLNPLADVIARWMEAGGLKKDDVWEVAMQLWASTHGYIVLYRGGRFSLSQNEFKKLVHQAMRRLLHGLKT